jgi:hypothetical protein
VEVTEVTRTGEPVRAAKFMGSRVVALVEHPNGTSARSRPGLRSRALLAPPVRKMSTRVGGPTANGRTPLRWRTRRGHGRCGVTNT